MTNVASEPEVVDFHLYDLSEGQGGYSPGFYINIPTGVEGDALYLEGPHETREDAIRWAKDFILNCLKEREPMTTVYFKKLTETAILPEYKTDGAAGMDLYADIEAHDERPNYKYLELQPGERCLIKTGFAICIPNGYEGQVRTRSGLALKQGLVVANSPGTVDSDYRGEVGVILHNIGKEAQKIYHGDRIAQMVIAKHEQPAMVVMKDGEDLPSTKRGTGGFGSTGI